MKMKKYLDMQISLNSTCNEKLIWLQLSVLKRAADHAQTPLKLHLSLTDLVKPTLVGFFCPPWWNFDIFGTWWFFKNSLMNFIPPWCRILVKFYHHSS